MRQSRIGAPRSVDICIRGRQRVADALQDEMSARVLGCLPPATFKVAHRECLRGRCSETTLQADKVSSVVAKGEGGAVATAHDDCILGDEIRQMTSRPLPV